MVGGRRARAREKEKRREEDSADGMKIKDPHELGNSEDLAAPLRRRAAGRLPFLLLAFFRADLSRRETSNRARSPIYFEKVIMTRDAIGLRPPDSFTNAGRERVAVIWRPKVCRILFIPRDFDEKKKGGSRRTRLWLGM